MWGIPLENNLKRNSMEGRLKKIGNEYKLYAQDDSCIATSWHSPHQRLSKNNCQAIENGYDLDELLDGLLINRGEHPSRVRNPLYGEERQLAKDLVQKALEILGDKKFSEEDMKKAMNKIVTATYSNKGDDIFDLFIEIHRKKYMDEYIQSLQQTEWDVEIEMWFHGTRHKKGEWIPKLDADGCLILKRK
jgi:hypothetical protein